MQGLYNAHGHTPVLPLRFASGTMVAGGARELRHPNSKKAQFVTALGINLCPSCRGRTSPFGDRPVLPQLLHDVHHLLFAMFETILEAAVVGIRDLHAQLGQVGGEDLLQQFEFLGGQFEGGHKYVYPFDGIPF
jgi:hypothetical protein